MQCFETFNDLDSSSGVETWRAYFYEDVDPLTEIIRWQAPIGIGDTELEAIADLCTNEDNRIRKEKEDKEREERYLCARYAPITEGELDALWELYSEDCELCFYDVRPLERLEDKGYVRGIRYDGPREWRLTEAGILYITQYYENEEEG